MPLGGNWLHIAERLAARVDDPCKVARATQGLRKLVKDRRVPNGPWYRAIRDETRVLCYICGQGTYVSTVLGPEMVPRGTQI